MFNETNLFQIFIDLESNCIEKRFYQIKFFQSNILFLILNMNFKSQFKVSLLIYSYKNHSHPSKGIIPV